MIYVVLVVLVRSTRQRPVIGLAALVVTVEPTVAVHFLDDVERVDVVETRLAHLDALDTVHHAFIFLPHGLFVLCKSKLFSRALTVQTHELEMSTSNAAIAVKKTIALRFGKQE